jgi:Fanconi anemia group M protein
MEQQPPQKHRIPVEVDFRERESRLFALMAACKTFEVRIGRLKIGDYILADRVVVERKTALDFAMSLVDGRLFPQAAALARRTERALLVVEGRRTAEGWPRVHPHALKGAVVSLALMWRLPVIFARDAEESLFVLRTAAEQAIRVETGFLRRYNHKPRRLTSRKLHVLQGLPGVGPTLARRMLGTFTTVADAMAADIEGLCQVQGIGRGKAEAILRVLQ